MMRLYWLSLFVFYFFPVLGQEPNFNQHDIGDAHAGIPINTLIQDHQCMLWLGTNKGLARYDGNSWFETVLDHPDSIHQVTSLFEDKSHRIWVGTASGKIYFLDQNRKMHSFEIDEGHPQKKITSIIQDPQGFIWFATYGEGVYIYTGSRLFNMNVDDGLSGQDIYAMISLPGGDVWLGLDDGINICTFNNEKKLIRKLGLADGLPDQIITALQTDAKHNVWIGTFEYGVVYYDVLAQKVTRRFENEGMDEITSFTIFDQDELWIGTHTSGLWRYHQSTNKLRRIENFRNMKLLQINDLLNDVEGNVWVTTEEGVLLSAFRPIERLEVNLPDIQTLFCDHREQLWVGTKIGLYRIEEYVMANSKPIRVGPQYDFNITDIYEDQFHNLWIGTLDNGLYIYNPVTSKVNHIGSIFNKGGITIMSIDATKDDIWIATLEGVVSYPVNKNILTDRQTGFKLMSDPWRSSLHFVFQVYVDSKDRVWFATDGNGVYCMDHGKVIQHHGNDSLSLKTVYSICEDQRGNIWFNTPDQGLVEYDGIRYSPLGLKEGLGNLDLASIMTAGTGDIIITHHRGIDLMEPDRRHFMYYSEDVGAKDIEPGLNAVTVDAKGHVYTSGRNVILKYYATKEKLSIHPRTLLTQINVFDKQIDFSKEHQFSYAQNYISFHYVGLWYTSPSAVKYLYKLEGYDLQWKESKDNVASYSNLAPGNYTFNVKASENNFFLDEPISSYSFAIAKPFWMRLWFIGLALGGIVGAIYWLVKSREKRSERQALIKKEMIESQLSALKAQINPHFLFNSFNTLITIIDENAMKPDVAIEYVEKLSDFYRSILQYREQDFISLEEEWEQVRNFMYLLEKRYGQHLRLHMEKPPGDSFILPLTLQMLVENAVKHNVISDKYPLDVYITIDDDQYVTVANNLQPKSSTEPSTQFGLQSILRQYQMLSDRKVIIEKNTRTFRVRIPIIKKSGT